MPALARGRGDYPDGCAATHAPTSARDSGEDYLQARAAVQRRTDRPYFIDKLPNNWLFVPFIH